MRVPVGEGANQRQGHTSAFITALHRAREPLLLLLHTGLQERMAKRKPLRIQQQSTYRGPQNQCEPAARKPIAGDVSTQITLEYSGDRDMPRARCLLRK